MKEKKTIDAHIIIGTIEKAGSTNNITACDNHKLNIMQLDLLKVNVPSSTHVLLSQLIGTCKKSRVNLQQKEKEIEAVENFDLESVSCLPDPKNIDRKKNKKELLAPDDNQHKVESQEAKVRSTMPIHPEAVANISLSTLPSDHDNFHSRISSSFIPRTLILNGTGVGRQIYEKLNENPKTAPPRYVTKECLFDMTCATDSCIEIFTDMYLCNPNFKSSVDTFIKTSRQEFFELLVNYCDDFDLNKLYQMRAEILYPMVKQSITLENLNKGNFVYSCEMNITRLLKKLMEDYPSVIENKTCSNPACTSDNRKLDHFFRSITLEQFHITGIEYLQEYVNDMFLNGKPTECSSCFRSLKKKSIYTTWEFNTYFAIDVEYLSGMKNIPVFHLTHPELKTHKFNFKTKFNRIPVELSIVTENFCLAAVMCFRGDPVKEP